MKRLAVETSTECCSVALQNGAEVIQRRTVEARSHARLILPWAKELLAEAELGFGDLDSLVVSRGPGGFTSLRIGLGVVQGIALARDLPVHPVSSLLTLAEAADPDQQHTQLLALLDARMGQVYAAWYERRYGQRALVGPELLVDPDQLECPQAGPWLAVGPGTIAFGEILAEHLGGAVRLPTPMDETTWPDAQALLRLADTEPAIPGHRVTPTYLRDQVTG
jgi:tRNA threonylcarbamoyladenosine biosynthesis protein TsaB